jgi:pepF/M3 family oligoendopeptidase
LTIKTKRCKLKILFYVGVNVNTPEKNWDLSPLYTSFESNEFQNDLNSIKPLILEFENSLDDYIKTGKTNNSSVNKEIIELYLKFSDNIDNLIIKTYSYAELKTTVNTNDNKALKYVDIIENYLSEKVIPIVKFQKYLPTINNLDEILNSNELIKEHSFHIKELYNESKYLLTDEEEVLYAKLKQTGSNAFTILQNKVSSNLMIDIQLNGEKKSLPLSSVRNLAYDKDLETRKKAYIKELESYKKIEEISAMALNSIKGETITISKKRGYKSPLDMSLQGARVDEKTLSTMLEAIEESTPKFVEYFKKKGELLGDTNGLKFYNLFAPIGNSNIEFTYEKAQEFILKQFYGFSDRLGNYAKKAFDNNWIDPFPKEGKLGGAFCANLQPIKESRILSNFEGSFNDMDTLAHELGHGYHGEVLTDVSILNSDYPMPLAETASIFCETIVFNAALKNAEKDDKIAILENSIMSSAQVIIDIYSRFLFESNLFKQREDGSLSVEEIKELMISAQKQAYKDGLDPEFLHPYMWICKPHYYDANYNFYNYPYAFGLLFAKGLYAQYEKNSDGFLNKYDELLKRTGNSSVYDAVKFVDIDLHNIEFWRSSLKIVTSEIDEFLSLV